MEDFLFSLEADNDDIDIDVSKSVTINDETAVDEAGSDSEVTDVSDISEKTAAHNEAASAGGVVVGDNKEDLEMDPVAASESYILRHFGLSREDLEEAVEETIAEAENIPNADVVEDDDSDLADTAVSSGGSVITADENNLDETPLDAAGKTPEVVSRDYPENADAPGTVATESLEQSEEGLWSILKSKDIDDYFKSNDYQVNKMKLIRYATKKHYTFFKNSDELFESITKDVKSDKTFSKKIYSRYRIIIKDNISYIIIPSKISFRALLGAALLNFPFAIIPILSSFIKHNNYDDMKCMMYPLIKSEDGRVKNLPAVTEVGIDRETVENMKQLYKDLKEYKAKHDKESAESLLEFCYF
jgi:hypothetical protein